MIGQRLPLVFVAFPLPLLLCATTRAQLITAFWEPVTITPAAIGNDPTLANMQSWDLVVETSGNWIGAEMRAILPSDLRFYKHPLGGFTKPDPALFGSSPALEFTTYVSCPSDDGANQTTVVLGSHGGAPNPSLGDLDGIFSVAWGELVSDPPGTYQITRLTFPQNALPDVYIPPVGEFSATSQIDPDSSTVIPDIPESSALGLLVSAGLILIRTRANTVLSHLRERWRDADRRSDALAEPLEARHMLSFSVAFPGAPTLSTRPDDEGKRGRARQLN